MVKGRKSSYNQDCGVVSLYLTHETKAKLTKLASQLSISKSKLINLLVNEKYSNSDAKSEKEVNSLLYNSQIDNK